jgi:hypothetical protein
VADADAGLLDGEYQAMVRRHVSDVIAGIGDDGQLRHNVDSTSSDDASGGGRGMVTALVTNQQRGAVVHSHQGRAAGIFPTTSS